MTECSRGRQRRQIQDKVREFAKEFAKELHVVGLMNMQLAVKDGENEEASQAKMLAFSFDERGDCTRSVPLYMIEVNPRASRTVPFVSKVYRCSARQLRQPLHARRNSRTNRLYRRSPRSL
ncbi:hypothetical protein BGX14_0668 [Fibrobacter sp. UWS1]|nr:hypothetical protein [Fibrobacter sp. UWS1]PBC68305.1 hypothetical protein BGX14_0668 [Fibrobacter sp. UWS1]